MKSVVALVILLSSGDPVAQAWTSPSSFSFSKLQSTFSSPLSCPTTCRHAKPDNSSSDPFHLTPEDDGDETPKLGIELGAMLDPLSEKEAAELKAAATEIINDAIAEGLDDIDNLRQRMNREFEKKRASMAAASEFKTNQESAKLLNKIDALTNAFLEGTEATRQSTKLAAAADQAMQGGVGVEIGAWGNVKGMAVATTAGSSLLGSVENAAQQQQKKNLSSGGVNLATREDEPEESTSTVQGNRILMLADTNQDVYAKRLVPALTDALQKTLPGLEVDVYKPTATLPIGGENAACVVVFCTSLSDKSAVYAAMDRLLHKTLQPGGAVGQPPTQLVAISTLGTERTNKMPYSLQNLVGRKLDRRRQIEEAVINTARQRVVEPALDFSICKLGELKESVSEPFTMAPGDVLDGTTAVDTAVTVLSQAIAFQPSARNATLCCVGQLSDTSEEEQQDLLDDAFLRLDGPELWRADMTTSGSTAQTNFEPLSEYIREWAELLVSTGKGLTTPVRFEVSSPTGHIPGVTRVSGVKLLFLPTATGKNYLSREEERTRETQESRSKTPKKRKNIKEGGIEVLVENTKAGALRVRARRCNYDDDAVIKELSEETILSRLKKGIDVWLKDHQTT